MTPPPVSNGAASQTGGGVSISEARRWVVHYSNLLFFVGGFIFDAIALQRIDSTLDLIYQGVYLLFVSWILILQERHARGWQPTGWAAKAWHHNVEALHFVYGGLLSADVIFYFKSSSFSRSSFFFGLLVLLMFANEMPQLRKFGSRLRLGLYAFCVVSYMNYLLPVLIGRMGGWVFALSMIVSALLLGAVLRKLAKLEGSSHLDYFTFGWSPALVLVLIIVFYLFKWIPPVPLSMQYAGIYHQVQRTGDRYTLTAFYWPWYFFWRRDDRPFLARSGDQIYCFVRVFAPRRFQDQVYQHWSFSPPGSTRWITSDRIPLSIYGGRGEGFRGVATKANYQSGRWRVDIESADGRALGEVNFEVRPDAGTEERAWRTRQM